MGEAAARALLDPSVPSGGYALVGPESLSGARTAAHWSEALGQPVSYTPDLAVMDALFSRAYGARKALDCQKSYRMVGKVKVPTSPADLQQTTFLLGRPPPLPRRVRPRSGGALAGHLASPAAGFALPAAAS